MNLLFLAAGTSGRILKISKGMPKPLIKIMGTSILKRNFRWVKKSELINNYFINTHFKPNLIKKEVDKIKKNLNIKITISNEKKILGTAGAVKKLEKKLGKIFLVIYSDNLLNFDLEKMLKFHNKKKSDLTMALYSIKKHPFTGIASSSIKLNNNSKITNFNEKRSSKGNSKYLVNSGVLILNEKIFKLIKKNKFCDFSNDIFNKIIKRSNINFFGYKIEKKNSYCLAIDTPEAYYKLQNLLKRVKLIN